MNSIPSLAYSLCSSVQNFWFPYLLWMMEACSRMFSRTGQEHRGRFRIKNREVSVALFGGVLISCRYMWQMDERKPRIKLHQQNNQWRGCPSLPWIRMQWSTDEGWVCQWAQSIRVHHNMKYRRSKNVETYISNVL